METILSKKLTILSYITVFLVSSVVTLFLSDSTSPFFSGQGLFIIEIIVAFIFGDLVFKKLKLRWNKSDQENPTLSSENLARVRQVKKNE
jgi:hypothetical protein